MPRCCAPLLGLLGLLALATAAPALGAMSISEARAAIANCLKLSEPGARGLAALEGRCRRIEQAVSALPPESLLSADWRDTVSAQELADLATLAQRYSGLPLSEQLSEARLRTIAAQLAPPSQPSSLWQSAIASLRRWLGPASDEFRAWLRSLGHLRSELGIFKGFAMVAIGLVVIAAVIVIMIELRAAGAFHRRRPARVRPATRPRAALRQEPSSGLAVLDQGPAAEHPVLLLELLIAALRSTRRLQRDRELTCRELAASAHFDTPEQRERFARLALLAEQVTYGSGDARKAPAEETLDGGRALYAELTTP